MSYVSIERMNSAVIFVLFAVLTAFVGNATASCEQVANDEMLEYYCEGGHPADLIAIPVKTEKLRISGMPLHRITTDTFSRFGGNLWVLGCSYCDITDIDANAFRGLVNLQQLSLDNNRLTSVRAAWFRGLSYLTYLDLNYNNIHEIEDEVYRNLPSLVDFRISGNRLRCLNLGAMSHLKELKFMLLSENPGFACPRAVSEFLESRSVTFEKDPEWGRLASDTIDVHVPSSHAEEDRTTTPAYYEKLYPDRRPSEKQEEVPGVPPHVPPSRDGDTGFYPNYQSEHRGRPRRPTTVRPATSEPMPRVEPRYPPSDVRSHVPELSIDQGIPYPYSVAETTRAPLAESRPVESIGMAGNERSSSQVEHTLTSYIPPTNEMMYYPSYTTSERSQTPPVNYDQRSLLEDAKIGEVDRSLQTERASTYPPYVSTYNIPHVTSERSQTTAVESVVSSSQTGETGFGGPLQTENVMTYPLYPVATSDDHEGLPHGYEATYPSAADYDTISRRTWTTNVPTQHSVDPSWTRDRERYEQSRPIEGDIGSPLWSTRPDIQETQLYGGHDSREIIKPSVDDVSIDVTNPVGIRDKEDRSKTTMSSDTYYVRPSVPSQPELTRLSSTEAPYYDSTETVYPLRNHPQHTDAAYVFPLPTTTDKSLPECPNSAALMIQSAAVLMLSVIAIFGQVIVEGF